MKALHSTEECPKCGYSDKSYEFVPQEVHESVYGSPIYSKKDHLLITCSTCNYNWEEPPKDGTNRDNKEPTFAVYAGEKILIWVYSYKLDFTRIIKDPRLEAEYIIVDSAEEAKIRDNEISIYKLKLSEVLIEEARI